MGRGGQDAQVAGHGPEAPFCSVETGESGLGQRAGGTGLSGIKSTFVKSCLAPQRSLPIPPRKLPYSNKNKLQQLPGLLTWYNPLNNHGRHLGKVNGLGPAANQLCDLGPVS